MTRNPDAATPTEPIRGSKLCDRCVAQVIATFRKQELVRIVLQHSYTRPCGGRTDILDPNDWVPPRRPTGEPNPLAKPDRTDTDRPTRRDRPSGIFVNPRTDRSANGRQRYQ